jgi:hypothetical protein
MPADRSSVDAELERVGVSYGKAGAADYIATVFRSDGVKLNGSAHEHTGNRLARVHRTPRLAAAA